MGSSALETLKLDKYIVSGREEPPNSPGLETEFCMPFVSLNFISNKLDWKAGDG